VNRGDVLKVAVACRGFAAGSPGLEGGFEPAGDLLDERAVGCSGFVRGAGIEAEGEGNGGGVTDWWTDLLTTKSQSHLTDLILSHRGRVHLRPACHHSFFRRRSSPSHPRKVVLSRNPTILIWSHSVFKDS
jgi:hypothetical protein